MLKFRILLAAVVICAAHQATAACVNKYIAVKDGPKYTLTILTGKLSYQEAYDLAQAVNKQTVPPAEWVDEKGKTIAKQIGEMKIIRPMPVSCDGKPTGVVLTATFVTVRPPSGKIFIKFDEKNTVELEQQSR